MNFERNGYGERYAKANRKKPWRMRAFFREGWADAGGGEAFIKTVAYKTQRAARVSADFETSCGAYKVEVWDSRLLDG